MAKQPIVKRVKVKATMLGYYDHKRRRPGAVFMMNETDYKRVDDKGLPLKDKSGNQAYCKWVELADSSAQLPSKKEKTSFDRAIEMEEMQSEQLAADEVI